MMRSADSREMTIEELLADNSHVYTREQFDADYKRIVTRICEKHGIAYGEVGALIREHRYVHDAEDIEQEYIEAMTGAGFEQIQWSRTPASMLFEPSTLDPEALAIVEQIGMERVRELAGTVWSYRLEARKP